jgi:DNA polymerase I-like protein with 3'-5' exonuclease and polymerase domains
MPLINADAKALEWYGAVFLSGDRVGYREISEGIDQHSVNREFLGFPPGEEGRLKAKTFVFRLIYGGSAYAYANDPVFTPVSQDQKFWEDVIKRFYEKYQDLGRWHNNLVELAMKQGYIEIPTGRQFTFKPERNEWGKWKWPRTKILNYPVQGFGADFMTVARVLVCKTIKERPHLHDVLFVCTVHDSLVFDAPTEKVAEVVQIIKDCWDKLPEELMRVFKFNFDLKPKVEVSVGMDWKHLTEIE